MGTQSCGPPIPENCPPGEAPVAATASCEPINRESDSGGQGCQYGAPYFPEDYCATDEEVEQESETEAYCGPGEVTPDGRVVPKPGC